MTIGGGADIIIIGYQNTLIQYLKSGHVFVANVNGLLGFTFGRLGDFFAVFICPRDKVGATATAEAGEAGDGIGCGGFVGVTHVGGAVGVVDGGGDVESLLVVGFIIFFISYYVTCCCFCQGRNFIGNSGIVGTTGKVAVGKGAGVKEGPAVVRLRCLG